MSTAARAPVTDASWGEPNAHPLFIEENVMPIVNIKITREGAGPGRNAATAEEKAALVKGVGQLLLDVLHKPLNATIVVIEELDVENWGWAGVPLPELRKQQAKGGGH